MLLTFKNTTELISIKMLYIAKPEINSVIKILDIFSFPLQHVDFITVLLSPLLILFTSYF